MLFVTRQTILNIIYFNCNVICDHTDNFIIYIITKSYYMMYKSVSLISQFDLFRED